MSDFLHRFIPPEDPRVPITLLLLHGTGGNEDNLLPVARVLVPGAAYLSPRGKVEEKGMPRFFRRLAEGVFDREDLIQRTHELAAFVEDAAGRYNFDLNRVVAVGFSNGANIAGSLLLLRPGLLSGAVLFRPMVPLVPVALPDLHGTPVFMAGGRKDTLVPPDETERLADLLRKAGASVDMHWQPGGHDLTQEDLHLAREWLRGLSEGTMNDER